MSALEPIPLDVGPPYAPRIAVLGLIPTVRVDVPICIILIVFFLAAAAVNLTIFIRNKSVGYNFLPSTVLVGFCTTRIIALSLRIAWATQPVNVKLNIAATIFAAAGVVLLFVLNLLFAHRLLRALHPNIGWLPAANYLFLFLYAYVLVCLLCAVTAAVVSYYTLAPDQLYKCRLVQLFASTSLALLAFLPVLLVLGALFYPGLRRPEPFGHGSISTKALLVLTTALLLTIGAAYRCAVNFAVRPVWFPAWWHHKACYYIFNYDLELVVVFAYALMRFDMRFHVPDGACKPGDYAKGLHVYKRVSTLAKVHDRRRADVEMCCPPSRSSRTCGSDYGSTQSSTSRSSRSGVIRGLSEVDDLRTVTDTARSSYPSTYLGSSYDSQTRSSESQEIVERESEKRSGGRSTKRSGRTKKSTHHHRHHHRRHSRRRSRDRRP